MDQGDHINLPDQPRLAELSWLDRLDSLPGFRAAAGIVVKGLRKALYSETDSQTITKYISYLYSHVGSEDFDTLSLGMVIFFLIRDLMLNKDISNFLVKRQLIAEQLLGNQDFYFLMLKIFTKIVGYGQSNKMGVTH